VAIEHLLRFSMSCAATETVVLTAVNSLTPSLVSPPENGIYPRRETDYPKTKGSGRGFVTAHLREGRGHEYVALFAFNKWIDLISYDCGLFIINKLWVFSKGYAKTIPYV